MKFANYENVININEAYSNFILKLTSVIDEIEHCETKKVKGNSKEWFDGLVSEEINNRDKPFKKLKKSRLPLDQENYNKARYEIEKLTEKNLMKKRGTTLKKTHRKHWQTKRAVENPKSTWII